MKLITMTACLAIIGCAISVRATTDNELSLETQAKPLADALRRAMRPMGGGPGSSSEWIKSIIRDNGIPKDAYVATIEKIAEESIADTVVFTNYQGKITKAFRRGLAVPSLINCIGSLGDPEFLPWLEKMTTEPEGFGIRTRAAEAYVKIVGLDATPFVQKILSGSEEKYDIGCKRVVAKEFFEQVAKAEASKAPQSKIDAAYKMLIEQAQSVSYVGHADQIDRFLSERLEGYRASTQRQRVVDRFINSTNEFARANFRKKQEELQKTPKADHADLSKRFPGLAEVKLEDEQQTEAPAQQRISKRAETNGYVYYGCGVCANGLNQYAVVNGVSRLGLALLASELK